MSADLAALRARAEECAHMEELAPGGRDSMTHRTDLGRSLRQWWTALGNEAAQRRPGRRDRLADLFRLALRYVEPSQPGQPPSDGDGKVPKNYTTALYPTA